MRLLREPGWIWRAGASTWFDAVLLPQDPILLTGVLIFSARLLFVVV